MDDTSTQQRGAKEVRHALRRIDTLVLLPTIFMFVFLQFRSDQSWECSHRQLPQGCTPYYCHYQHRPNNLRSGHGGVGGLQAFITSRPGFLATRFLLATFDTGFIPGAAFYLGHFLTRRELAFRYAMLWAANSIAGALGSVLALGLLSLNERGGLHGWQLLFTIEGALTCFIAGMAALHLPRGPEDAQRTHRALGQRFSILQPGQGDLSLQRAIQDDLTKSSQKSNHVALRDFDFLLEYRVWGHILVAFLTSIIYTPINTYAPSIIQSLRSKGYTANGLNSVGPACILFIALTLAYCSDRTRHRPGFVLAWFLLSAVGLLWLASPPYGTAQSVLYAGVVFTEAFMGCVQGLNASWLSENMQERQRPLTLGCYVMSIQLASFVGSNAFRPYGAPCHTKRLVICAGCVLAGALVCVIWALLYRFATDKQSDDSILTEDSIEKVNDKAIIQA